MNRKVKKILERNLFLEQNRHDLIDDRNFWRDMYAKLHNENTCERVEFKKNNAILG